MSRKQRFVRFLLDNGILTFGRFVTRSGRVCPYFLNTANSFLGSRLRELGRFFAEGIREAFPAPDAVCALTGRDVPLAAATAMAMAETGADAGYLFRSEESGAFIGAPVFDGQRIVLVSDVVPSGHRLLDQIQLLRRTARVEIVGLIVAADRQEKGVGEKSELAESAKNVGIDICALVTLDDIIMTLSDAGEAGDETLDALRSYRAEYCR
ncbi:MAG: hypothetical protein KIG36_04570 [Eubacteriales bacterium]|nr:hypothetical protein [Eubacteriales bacterium]